jgi:hypothetical protein
VSYDAVARQRLDPHLLVAVPGQVRHQAVDQRGPDAPTLVSVCDHDRDLGGGVRRGARHRRPEPVADHDTAGLRQECRALSRVRQARDQHRARPAHAGQEPLIERVCGQAAQERPDPNVVVSGGRPERGSVEWLVEHGDRRLPKEYERSYLLFVEATTQ